MTTTTLVYRLFFTTVWVSQHQKRSKRCWGGGGIGWTIIMQIVSLR